jgi:hypothetical protein
MKTSYTKTAARIFAGLMGGTSLFQLALAAGMPWAEVAWGGAYQGTLPIPMRFASLGSVAILLFQAYVALVRAGLIASKWSSLSRKLIWVVVAYAALGILANAASPSFWETVIWVPIALLAFVTSLIVARSN